jgi:hypothetical protein
MSLTRLSARSFCEKRSTTKQSTHFLNRCSIRQMDKFERKNVHAFVWELKISVHYSKQHQHTKKKIFGDEPWSIRKNTTYFPTRKVHPNLQKFLCLNESFVFRYSKSSALIFFIISREQSLAKTHKFSMERLQLKYLPPLHWLLTNSKVLA